MNDTIFYPSMQIPPYSHNKKFALANALLDWGGFAPIKPIFGSQSPYNSDQEMPVDVEGMRKVLNWAAQFAMRPDPSFETVEVPKPTKVTKVTKINMERDTRESVRVQQAPARRHSRSWSLPPPSPDLPTTTSSSKRVPTGPPTNATKLPAGTTITARQQQILAKAKLAKQPAINQPKSKRAPTASEEVKKPEVQPLRERIWSVVKSWF